MTDTMKLDRYGFLTAVVVTLLVLPALAQSDSLKDEPAPGFDLPTLTGEQLALQDLRGKIVVLHFGAGW